MVEMKIRSESNMKLEANLAHAVLKDLFGNAPSITKSHIIGIRNHDVKKVMVADKDGWVWCITQDTFEYGFSNKETFTKLIISLPKQDDSNENEFYFEFDGISSKYWCNIFDREEWLHQ